MRLIIFLIFSSLVIFGLSACEDSKEKNLFKAQTCIDTATAATVNTCLSYLGDDTSARAYILRCSAIFISQDITEVAMIEALENIDDENAESSPTITAISALAMEDTTTSASAVSTCTLSESDALIALANFANLATATGKLAGILNNPTQEDLEAFINSYNSGTVDQDDREALGNAIISSQSSLCNTKNGLMKDTEACKDINAAIAGGADANTIADTLIAELAD